MELTKESFEYKEIMELVNANYFIKDRLQILKNFGFSVCEEWINKSGGVGTIITKRGKDCVQISASKKVTVYQKDNRFELKLAWVAYPREKEEK